MYIFYTTSTSTYRNTAACLQWPRMRISSNFFVILRWYCSYLEDRKKKFHPGDGHGGPDTPMFKKKKKSKEEKHYMSSRCSCGVIKVSTARCDIPLRLEAATLATCFLDHNAASAPPRRRKHSTFSPHFLRVFEIAPLWKFGDTVCVSNVWVFFGADATLFPSTKLKLRCRQICRHCFKTSTRNADIFFYSPLCPA